MFQDFEKMSLNSRVWIYQANRTLSAKEENVVQYSLKTAIENWNAHSTPLLGSVNVIDSRFVIVTVDEGHQMASGCSIDASTKWLTELGSQLNLDFFDRSIVYQGDTGLSSIAPFGIKSAVEKGQIKPETVIYNNNAIQTIAELHSKWRIRADKSIFFKRYFEKLVA
ncbi:hypothetical protein [Jiulongibacter sp. NS-SX5]|uniref:hypothetical protein n=1 Tax=Jiulongibacter sp. NS-SX5 TaxID=3463854 RepID=UPI00405961FE